MKNPAISRQLSAVSLTAVVVLLLASLPLLAQNGKTPVTMPASPTLAAPAPVLPAVAPALPKLDPVKADSTVTDTVTYPFPPEIARKVRDQQLDWDELEIANEKMLVIIEQNKQKQKADEEEIARLAYKVSVDLKVDLNLYEGDAKKLSFGKKKGAIAK